MHWCEKNGQVLHPPRSESFSVEYGPVHATLEGFENGIFTRQSFSVHITPEEFENEAITSDL